MPIIAEAAYDCDLVIEELESLELPESDGMPMDTGWHRECMNLLIDSVSNHWRGREDFFAGGNMCMYYSVEQARRREFLGPDVFFVLGVNRLPNRRIWATWLENNRVPNVAIELSSRSSRVYDRTDKKDLYEQQLRTPEYFVYDPESNELLGWKLDQRGHYQPIAPAANGRLWSDELKLWLGTWRGVCYGHDELWLRYFDRDGNLCLLDSEEAQLQAEQAQAKARAESERAQAESERAAAETERANRAEAELQRLRELLKSQASGQTH